MERNLGERRDHKAFSDTPSLGIEKNFDTMLIKEHMKAPLVTHFGLGIMTVAFVLVGTPSVRHEGAVPHLPGVFTSVVLFEMLMGLVSRSLTEIINVLVRLSRPPS